MLKFLDKETKRVCILGNQHGLLHYLLLSSMDEIQHTFFLWNFVSFQESVKRKFGKKGVVIPRPHLEYRTGISLIDFFVKSFCLFFDYRIYYPLRFPFLLNYKLDFWGHDHVYKAHYLLRNHSFQLVEDGTLNYMPYQYPQPKQNLLWLKRLLAGKNYGFYKRYSGEEKTCVAIHLTGLSNSGEVLNDPRVKIKSFSELWKESSEEKRLFINNVFSISESQIAGCKNHRHILMTQSFSEDQLISEEEKIDMYKKIIEKIGEKDIVIKPHPRETTDYSKYFPDLFVLKSYAPFELFTLNGVKFEKAYSVSSSALLGFPYKIKICFLGTEIYHPLFEKCPEWASDKFTVTNNENIEIIKL